MLIQGNDLVALKARFISPAGRVKCIFIHRPYNTCSALLLHICVVDVLPCT